MTKFCGPLFVFLVSVVAVPYAHAQLYWDVNGTNPGSSDSGDASGTWSSTSATWNTAADGSSAAPAAWVPDSVGVFSAGSSSDGYTVTLTDAESASGITFQDGPNGLTLAASGAGQLTLTGSATVNAPVVTALDTISAPIAGTAGLNLTGTALLVLSGANTYSGPTSIPAGGTIKLGAANAVPSGSVLTLPTTASNGARLLLNGFDDAIKSISGGTGSAPASTIDIGAKTLTLADPQGESTSATLSTVIGGKVVKNGTGSITLNGATAVFAGGEFIINNGNVTVGANNCFGTSANNSTLTMNGGSISTSSNMSMNTQNLAIAGSFAANVNTTGNFQFLGNAGNGPTILKANNPTITVNPDSGTVRPVVIAPNQAAGVQNGIFILAGIIQDDSPSTPRGFTKAGDGMLSVANPTNSYTGETTIQQGLLRLAKHIGANAPAGDGRLGDGTHNVNLSGGTLTYNGSVETTDASRTLTVPNPIHVTADSAISYYSTTQNLVPSPANSLTDFHNIYFVFNNNDISGTGGTLTLKNDGVCTSNSNTCTFRPTFTGSGFNFSRPVAINNQANDPSTGRVSTRGTVLQSANTTGTQTWSGAVSGTGILRRSVAGGTTVLSGANTFSGGAIVDGGTLTASGSLATLGGGDVTVNAGNAAISAGVANAIFDTAKLTLLGGGAAGVADTGFIDLAPGINEVIGSLVLGSTAQANGTYGSTLSTATFKNNEYFSGTGIVTVGSVGLAGDYNGDGKVDAADYVMWRKNPGTFGGDPAGYTTWRQNFGLPGAGSGLSGGGTVPEPGVISVVVFAIGSVFLYRRAKN